MGEFMMRARLRALIGDSRTILLASKLLGSSVSAQMAALVATTFAATQAQPSDFAQYAAVAAASAVISSFSSLAVETRIPVLGDKAAALIRAGFTAMLTIDFIILLAGLVLLASQRTLAINLILVAIASFAISIVGLMSAIVIRQQRQHLLASNRLTQGFSNAGLVIVLISTPLPGYFALTGAWVTSLILGGLVMGFGIRDALGAFRPAQRTDWSSALREVKLQPVNNALANFGTALPALLLPALGSMTLAGAWALLSRVLNAVVQTVFVTISPLYAGGAAAIIRESRGAELAAYHVLWIKRLLLLAPFMLAGIWIGGVYLIPLLGRQWEAAQLTLVPASLFFTALLVWLPLSQTLVLLGRTTQELVWTLANLAAGAGSLALIPILDGLTALLIWAALQPLSMAIHLLLQRRGIRAVKMT